MFRLSYPCKIIVSRMCPGGVAPYSTSAATPPTGCSGGSGEKKGDECPSLTNPCTKPCEKKTESKDESPKLGPTKKTGLCYENPCCPDTHLAYDSEFKQYLDELDKKELPRTWWECPPRRVVKKVVCDLTKAKEEPPSLKSRVPTGLVVPPKPISNKRCPKLTMPGCCPPVFMRRDKGGCKVTRPLNCKKIEAPFCSFSECKKCKPPKLHPSECQCLMLRSLCGILAKEGKIVYKYASKNIFKPPKLPEHCP